MSELPVDLGRYLNRIEEARFCNKAKLDGYLLAECRYERYVSFTSDLYTLVAEQNARQPDTDALEMILQGALMSDGNLYHHLNAAGFSLDEESYHGILALLVRILVGECLRQLDLGG